MHPEILPSPRDAAFHGADADPERLGDVTVGLAHFVAHGEDFAVMRSEFFHARDDQLGKLAGCRLLGGVRSVTRDKVGKCRLAVIAHGAVQRQRGLAVTTQKIRIAVARKIEGDAVQPSGERGFTPETRQATIGTDEGILGDFFGVSVVAQQGKRDGEHFPPMTPDNFDEGRLVASVKAPDQLGVVHRRCAWNESPSIRTSLGAGRPKGRTEFGS